MAKQKNDNLSKGDFISFIAILLLGITVFFGMNFQTLGDKVPSAAVAILLIILMLVFVFLAAHAKAQDRNQAMWRKVEYSMLGLYVLALIPCFIYSSKFFDIQFGKADITAQVQADLDDINDLFSDYGRKCESRCGAFKTKLDAMVLDEQGRESIARILEIGKDSVSSARVNQVCESFVNMLKGNEYKALEAEKNNLEVNTQTNFKNWNLLFIPQYASELGSAKSKYATKLKEIYEKHTNNLEKEVPEFQIESYLSESNIITKFSSLWNFSIIGLLVVILLGGLGLVKYFLGAKRTVIEFTEGSINTIQEDGGFTF